jgi:hypothetical protein
MITDYQRYCGSALLFLIDSWEGPVNIRRLFNNRNGYYLVEEKLPLALKFSRSRKGPWSFTYHREHQVIYSRLVETYDNCVTAYICGSDGIVAVEHSQLRQFLDESVEEQENVSIRRKLNKMYSIRGRDGVLDKKVGRDSYLKLIKDILKL